MEPKIYRLLKKVNMEKDWADSSLVEKDKTQSKLFSNQLLSKIINEKRTEEKGRYRKHSKISKSTNAWTLINNTNVKNGRLGNSSISSKKHKQMNNNAKNINNLNSNWIKSNGNRSPTAGTPHRNPLA